MTPIRRLDHVAVLVHDTDAALRYFRDQLGLEVKHSDEIDQPPVRLTYLDAGNAWIQLVEPRDPSHPLAQQAEGLHHICFGVDDAVAGAAALASAGAPPPAAGRGRGPGWALGPGEIAHGVRVECTEFRRDEDVDRTAGWLENG
jgi:methylmalonyl-CoA/ethylmalonyl-CoA epimerase